MLELVTHSQPIFCFSNLSSELVVQSGTIQYPLYPDVPSIARYRKAESYAHPRCSAWHEALHIRRSPNLCAMQHPTARQGAHRFHVVSSPFRKWMGWHLQTEKCLKYHEILYQKYHKISRKCLIGKCFCGLRHPYTWWTTWSGFHWRTCP